MDEVPKSLRDVAYVAVGLAVIGFQRAQVRRRELARQLDVEELLPRAVRDVMEVLRSRPPPRTSPPPRQPS